MVEHITGGERLQAVRAGGLGGLMQAQRLAGAAPVGETDVAAIGEQVRGPLEVAGRGAVDPGHQGGDKALGMLGDILPMEKALPLLAPLRIGARLAAAEQAGKTELRSTMPSAGIPISAAVANNCSHDEAPRRKEKWVVT
jgi:hypothetical protein